MKFHFPTLTALISGVKIMDPCDKASTNSIKWIYGNVFEKICYTGERIFLLYKRNTLHFLTSETKSIWSNVCRTFWAQSPRIYDLQPNGDNQENHKEILNQTGGGTFKKNFKSFKA